ncbi:MAG TPA: hypothetical protein VN879_20420 [Candidatus Acidoferrales bacterium]|nr:hypothetical protein [Candidatus Acidoferrales bacterium]
MKQRANEWIGYLYPEFHKLRPTEQILRLVYFHTVVEGRETISLEELCRLFDFVSVPTPDNLPQMLFYLATRGKRLLNEQGEYLLRRQVRQLIEEEIAQVSGFQAPVIAGPAPAFEFPDKKFKDAKVKVLIDEAKRCYATECWNACGILVRIVIERGLDSVSPAVKAIAGLRDKLNYCISNPGSFSKSIVEGLKELKGAKLIGDIVAHHSNITLDKHDIDVVAAPFRMVLKEIQTI